MHPTFKYFAYAGPIVPFELHTWGESLDMPVAVHLDEETSDEAISDLQHEVFIVGDSFGFSVERGDVRWWIDLGPNIPQWEAEGIPTLLRAISVVGESVRLGLRREQVVPEGGSPHHA